MAPGFDHAALVKDLRKQVTALEDDLRVQSDEVERFATALRAEYDLARQAERTAATYGAWRDERVTQVAAAWVLGTVFVRFCEDNQLIEWPYIAGPGERLADAEERHEAFFRAHPSLNDRDWIIEAFNHLASTHPAVAGLFDRDHNPLWEIEPSFEAATELLRFWRRREGRYDFTDPSLDTRFLGDLYQDLSEHARKTYALLQTPEFVEEFILDLTLEPAVEEFGLKGLRTIDPACGSGHFLLGIFARLIEKWRAAEPGTDDWTLIRRSMESVHGCDKNPFAASIARFRLLIAAVCTADEKNLANASVFPINVAVGDSLLHGRGAPGLQMELFEASKGHTYRTEDIDDYVRRCDLLGRGSYHVAVGNPPYITPKDKQENENYRRGYDACSGKYALSVPFVQCLFHLAIRTHGSERAAGYVGQITANSFMKREFGKKLIEEFFPAVHLSHVIDTSGAYLPGHGTPTVVLVGRNHTSRANEPVRAALGVRGELSPPSDPSRGRVWLSIVEQIGIPGSQSEWLSVEDLSRARFYRYPWSLSGGGAAPLVERMTYSSSQRLGAIISGKIGPASFAGLDDPFFLPPDWHVRNNTPNSYARPLVTGEYVRDWGVESADVALAPYSRDSVLAPIDLESSWGQHLWRYRRVLQSLAGFDGTTRVDSDEPWWSWYRWIPERYKSAMLLTFASVSTHQQFSLSRSFCAFNRHAPVIKLPGSASEEVYLSLLAALNSAIACFWLKQVCQDKGNRGGERSTGRYAWESYFEFTGSKVQEFPLPKSSMASFGRKLDELAGQLVQREPSAVCKSIVPSRVALDVFKAEYDSLKMRMIALQEELDWCAYGLYGIIGDDLLGSVVVDSSVALPEVGLGERAFEIFMAPMADADEAVGQWFVRHGSTPTSDVPGRWPEWYRDVVRARIDVIEKRKDIALIERPECKRRWSAHPWEKKESEALRAWLLDRCENPDLWVARRDGMKQPRALTVSQLADQFKDDADMQSVAQLYATDHLKKRDLTLAQILEQVIADQHVPYLAAMRYKDSGLRKRQQWEETWELQREEDRTGKRLDIAVPPKYTSADFKKTSYWSQRGKLDVPKERFISYPDANPDSDPTLLLGWAGWDHKDQAQALVNIVNDRTDQAGWGTDKIQPLLAGLLEVMPWVKQWHGEYDDEWGGNPAEEYQAFLDGQRAKHQLTEDDLRGWRPAAATRGRKKG